MHTLSKHFNRKSKDANRQTCYCTYAQRNMSLEGVNCRLKAKIADEFKFFDAKEELASLIRKAS